MMTLCSLFGHKYGVKPVPIHTNIGTPNGETRVGYHAYICERGKKANGDTFHACGHRKAATFEDEKNMGAVRSSIASIMSGERARLGLRPISWDM